MRRMIGVLVMLMVLVVVGCSTSGPNSDQVQRQQELLAQESNSQVGMPAIKNFREKRLLKDILELRDQEGLVTYTYLWNEFNGRLVYLGESIGYGIPYATQFTNPEKIADAMGSGGFAILPQMDPNGLFSPAAAEGTWVLLKDPAGGEVKPVYIEPRILVSPFRLTVGVGQ